MIEQVIGFALLGLALFVPGYLLSLAFFAKRNDIDAVERVTLSFVFGIIFLPLFVMLENLLFGVSINQFSVWANFAVISIAGLVLYLARIGKIPLPVPKVSRDEAVSLIPGLGKK